jgi:hypothetical protein
MSSRYRKVVGVSLNPAEHDAVQTLMSHGGYTNFSEFAKAKILGVASESENRLRDLETAVENMSHSNARHHKQWVDTVKRVSGSDAEPLVAAIYALLHMMARPQDRAAIDQEIDLERVKMMMGDDSNGYRRTRPTHYKQANGNEPDLSPDSHATTQLSPYQAGKNAASGQWHSFGRQPQEDQT